MKTIKLTAGEAIIRYLDNQYVSFDGIVNKFVERAYTVFGHGCVLGAGEALAMSKHNIKVMQGKNEQGMAQAAISYAKQSNRTKIIPCFSSIGPGAANMVTAAATATVNNIPLLLFPGDTYACRQPDPVLQQVEQTYDLNITTNDAFRPVAKFFDRINRSEQVMTALLNAMRVLLSPADTGAVCIALPQDVQGESYDYPLSFFEKKIHKIIRQPAAVEELEEAVKAIRKAKRPLLIIGGGVRYSKAKAEAIAFAESFNIPIAETQAGKGTIPSSHLLNLGGIGVTGNLAANIIAADADIVIGAGTRFSDFTTASKSLYPSAKTITINVNSYHANKLDAIKVSADAGYALAKLTAILSKKKYYSKYTTEIKDAKKLWSEEYNRLANIDYCKDFVSEVEDKTKNTIEDFAKISGGAVCQTSALAAIRDIIADNAIAVGASGSLPGCMQRMWTTEVADTYNMEYGYSCMGYEIAGALGSKLASPSQEVYAFVGDGSFLMLHSEMHTALQEGMKINILLFDNGGFGCINNLQMGTGIDSACTEFRYRKGEDIIPNGEYIPVDYAKIASGYGYISYTARTLDELKAALTDSKLQRLPTLIDIKVLPKTMTHGYNGWWNTGCSTLPRTKKAKEVLEIKTKQLKRARKY
ncbi:MAG: 3D-(3,5/4)-trihydroxycyclohexane-1,2-dione acylhydrolase (decyclizing) [Clostridia bacterium]|nr:3D-(3,5/4)-trihydroxycyclohexane-1,2-dione acylhydrolase (decyclizing) [Clostridia bacterium]